MRSGLHDKAKGMIHEQKGFEKQLRASAQKILDKASKRAIDQADVTFSQRMNPNVAVELEKLDSLTKLSSPKSNTRYIDDALAQSPLGDKLNSSIKDQRQSRERSES